MQSYLFDFYRIYDDRSRHVFNEYKRSFSVSKTLDLLGIRREKLNGLLRSDNLFREAYECQGTVKKVYY
jgi:hypothetical protein